MSEFTAAIEEALDTQPDYSQGFTDRVAGIARAIADELDAEVRHGRQMNYRAAQSVEVHVSAQGEPVEPDSNEATRRLVVLVSSRGPLYTVVTLERVGERQWTPWKDDAPRADAAVLAAIDRVMASRGLERVSGHVLDRPVEGRTTEMDGAPATLMDVLFAEIV